LPTATNSPQNGEGEKRTLLSVFSIPNNRINLFYRYSLAAGAMHDLAATALTWHCLQLASMSDVKGAITSSSDW